MAPLKTGKERLGDKASDHQRTNYFKVPADRRGSKIRPDTCGAEAVVRLERMGMAGSAQESEEVKCFGAHHMVASRDGESIYTAAGLLDLLLIAVNTPMDWTALVKTLRPNGRMAIVGAVLEPLPISAIDLIFVQRSLSDSLNGGLALMSDMLEFAARHCIRPAVEQFPMSRANDALDRLAAGKAGYRVVLDAG